MQTATQREVRVRHLGGRFHDGIWDQLFSYFATLLTRFGDVAANAMEHRAFTTFARTPALLGNRWPADIRNTVNYRPGFAYDAVRGGAFHDLVAFIRDIETWETDEVIAELNIQTRGIVAGDTVLAKPERLCRVLTLVALLIRQAATDLLADVVDRQGLDRRWQAARTNFIDRVFRP